MSAGAAPSRIPQGFAPHLPEGARRSHALESLTTYLGSRPGMHILDFGGINQANLDYLTGLGHRVYAVDLIRSFDQFFSTAELKADRLPPERVEAFLDSAFDFPDQSTDGALVWDTLQYLPRQVSDAALDRLYRILAPDSLVLAFFHPELAGSSACTHVCRMLDNRHLQILQKGTPRPVQSFNARGIERFFQAFRAVRFFVTRESLQEVVVRR